jgi:hypothetical protein
MTVCVGVGTFDSHELTQIGNMGRKIYSKRLTAEQRRFLFDGFIWEGEKGLRLCHIANNQLSNAVSL